MLLQSNINNSYTKQSYWFNLFLTIVPDAVLSIGIAYFTESGVLGFLISMIGLQCIYFLIWLKNTIWQSLLFKYRGKKLMAKHIESMLKASNFPCPDEQSTSFSRYLNNIVENNELDIDIRIKAAAEIGAISYPVACLKMQESLRLNKSYEEALKNYKMHLENKVN